MPPTPVDDHTEEFEQLAGLQALDVLEGEDLQRFEQHAAHCERCQLMVQTDREALALAAPEMDPSPDFKARLMQRAAQELAAPTEPPAHLEDAQRVERQPVPLRPREERPPNVVAFRRRAPWASAIAAVLVLGIVTAGGYAYQNQVVASYALQGSVGGSAVVNVRRNGSSELALSGIQNPPSGYVYEAWLIPPNGQPIPAGTMAQGDARLPLDRVGSGTTVAITQERGRVDAPTGAPLMAVVVQS
jgi:Anti-sigma-K factor rskA, C-terminal